MSLYSGRGSTNALQQLAGPQTHFRVKYRGSGIGQPFCHFASIKSRRAL